MTVGTLYGAGDPHGAPLTPALESLPQQSEQEKALLGASSLRYATYEVAPSELPDMLQAAGAPGRQLFSRSDMGLLGIGEALRLPMPAAWASKASTSLVEKALSSIAPDDVRAAPSTMPAGPTAIGALPYDPSLSGYLTVPKLLLGRRGDRAWVTAVAPEGATCLDAEAVREKLSRLIVPPLDTGPAPDGFTLTPAMPHEQWKQLVQLTVAQIEAGELAKVVLARRVDVTANRPFLLHESLGRLAALYPSCAIFRVEGFIGASPEVLLRKAGTTIFSHPLAGTAARSGDQATDDATLASLLASPKHRREHQFVVDAIAEKLKPLCRDLVVPRQPSVLALRNVSHLGTAIRGTLDEDGPPALELAALLQPTPAVGGHPTGAALAWQRSHEGFDRGWYAGPVGWVDAAGDGEWVLGLRSASVNGATAQLFAGNGIVSGSDPETELAETQLKMQALLAALVRP
jgi:menaquinone-specific isochorismate synthase